jgi:hypothetical protein
MPTATPVTSFPWQPDSTVTGNLAIGNLRENLLKALKNQRGIHTETLLTAVGALAGFAAQNAALDRLASNTPRAPNARILKFGIAHGKTGERFMFGDVINILLFPEPESVLPLGALVAGAAVSAGVKEEDLPNYGEIVAHIASTVGSQEFGTLRTPKEHPTQLQPLDALRRFWPMTRDVLRFKPPKRLFRAAEKPLQEIHWPIVISVVASQLILMTKAVLNPAIAAAIVMESAVITSKIDPETIEPGKWQISHGEGEAPVTRLRT